MILCIDDEPTGLRIRKLLLESKGYRVMTAESGMSGLKLFSENSIDLVVLDYVMPNMDGGAVAAEMRRTKPQVPILMLSAYVDLPPAVLDSVDAYALKGESPVDFLSSVSHILNAKNSAGDCRGSE